MIFQSSANCEYSATYITVKLLVFSTQDSTHKIPADYSQLYMTHDVIGKILQCKQ